MTVASFVPTTISAGILDAINPLVMMNAAVVILLSGLKPVALSRRRLSVILFCLGYVFSSVVIFCGIDVQWYLNPAVTSAVRYGYFVFALISMMVSAVFFVDWCSVYRQRKAAVLKGDGWFNALEAPQAMNWLQPVLACIIGGVLGIGGSFWPPDGQVTLMANYLYMPGFTVKVVALLVVYNFLMLWPILLFMWLVAANRASRQVYRFLLTIIFLAAGFIGVYIF